MVCSALGPSVVFLTRGYNSVHEPIGKDTTLKNYELGNHTATFDPSTGRLAISGTSGSILLSAEEALKLQDTLYLLKEALLASVHQSSENANEDGWTDRLADRGY